MPLKLAYKPKLEKSRGKSKLAQELKHRKVKKNYAAEAC